MSKRITMSNIYLGYHFLIEPKDLGSEILIAELGELPFESFVESEYGITAYIQKSLWLQNSFPILHSNLLVLFPL